MDLIPDWYLKVRVEALVYFLKQNSRIKCLVFESRCGIDCKKTVVCVVQNGMRDCYSTIGPDVGSMRKFLLNQRHDSGNVHMVFEVSGQAGFIYDSLEGACDTITVANPNKMTWIYRTAKKNDRIDARNTLEGNKISRCSMLS